MAVAKPSSDSVYIVWSEQYSGIFFKRNAISFDPSINLSNTTGQSRQPALAVSLNDVYVVWSDDTPGTPEILYRRSTDGGASFGATMNLSNTPGNSDSPAVAVSGNNVYVMWSDNSSGNPDILYRKSLNGGTSFGGTVNLSNTTGYSSSPAIAVSGSNVYLAWIDDSLRNSDILYRISTDWRDSFGNTMNLSNTTGKSYQPAIAASGDFLIGQSVYVVWTDDTAATRNSEILYRRSTDGGASFGATMNLSNTPGNSYAATVAASLTNWPQQQDVYVVWTDDSIVNSGVLYRKSTDGGASFGRTMRLLTSEIPHASVAVSGKNVYVVYNDRAGTEKTDIFYRKSTDGADFFEIAVNLSNTSENSSSPHVAASSNLSL